MMCSMGSNKDHMLAKPFPSGTSFPMGMYNPHHLQAMSNPEVGHHHSLMPGSLSAAMGMGCHMEPPLHPPHHHHHHIQNSPSLPHLQQPQQHQQQQQAQPPPKYQLGSTSYLLDKPLKVEMESFLMDLQSGLPGHHSGDHHHAASSPPKEGLEHPSGLTDELCGNSLLSKSPAVIAESLCTANMDFSHLLGFLPLNLPPYNAPISTAGLVMGYTSSAASSSSSSSSSSSLHAAEPHAAATAAAAPLTSLQPQPQEQQGSSGGLGLGPLHPLPPVFSSSLSTTTLPRFHQAFQ